MKRSPVGPDLTPKQLLFCEEYPKDCNGTAAAIRAGYSARGAKAAASRLLDHPEIQARLKVAIERRAHRVGVDAEAVLREIQYLALSDIGEVMDFDTADGVPRLRAVRDVPAHARKAIASVKVNRTFVKGSDGKEPVETIEFKFWDKPRALEQLLRHLGLAQTFQIPIDPTTLTDEQLQRIADGDHPLRVLADTRRG